MKSGRCCVLCGAMLLGGLAGCAPTPARVAPGPAVSGFAPCPCDNVSGLPRARLTPAPAPGLPGAPPGGVIPPDPTPAPGPGPGQVPGPESRGYAPTDPVWRPSQEPPQADPRGPNVRLSPPVIGEEQKVKDRQPPVVGEEQKVKDPLPTDIPQFSPALKSVDSGQKPFPEGFAWLREKGYRTVLYVRAPGDDNTADKKLAHDKGLRFASLELSPATLTRDVVSEFSRFVKDSANHPLYVYDRDSSLLGGLWYLHFRAEGLNDERARVEAERLGFKIEADGGPHKEMWLAVQRYLQLTKPMSRSSVHTASWQKAR